MDPLGLSFMPGDAGNADPNKSQQSPVQQAIQTLSLRIPRTVGAGSAAPGQLLNSPGGSALGGNVNSAALLEQIRRMLFGGGANFGTPTAPGAPVLPTPSPAMGPMPGAPIGAPRPGLADPGASLRLPPKFTVGDPNGPGVEEPKPMEAAQTPEEPRQPLGPALFERGPRNRQV